MFAQKVCESFTMSAHAQRFAQLVLDAFRAAGHTTDSDVGRVKGPSTSTMTKLRAAAAGAGELAQPRSTTWAAIERAANWPAGSARTVWDGGGPPTPTIPEGARQVGDPEDDLVEFTVEGNFGVRAVVRGPVRDMEALQAAVSKLISGMQVEESNNRALP